MYFTWDGSNFTSCQSSSSYFSRGLFSSFGPLALIHRFSPSTLCFFPEEACTLLELLLQKQRWSAASTNTASSSLLSEVCSPLKQLHRVSLFSAVVQGKISWYECHERRAEVLAQHVYHTPLYVVRNIIQSAVSASASASATGSRQRRGSVVVPIV